MTTNSIFGVASMVPILYFHGNQQVPGSSDFSAIDMGIWDGYTVYRSFDKSSTTVCFCLEDVTNVWETSRNYNPYTWIGGIHSQHGIIIIYVLPSCYSAACNNYNAYGYQICNVTRYIVIPSAVITNQLLMVIIITNGNIFFMIRLYVYIIWRIT